jgi:hypothetical protein
MNVLTWIGIGFCVTQSAMFSGLNLAFFSVSKLRLEIEAAQQNALAAKVLAVRSDPNFLLTTVLWGNVGINVLLTLLADSVLAGVTAFLFSTVVITFFGEIIPQAYFSRNAIRMASLLTPVFRFYQLLLFPVAKPTAVALDWWLGHEGIAYFLERDLREVIKKHMEASETDIDSVEGRGALNFLALDDLAVMQEGEPVHPQSIVSVPVSDHRPVFPAVKGDRTDPFLQQIQASGKKWVILTDPSGEPQFVLDADGFLRAVFFGQEGTDLYAYCHRPIVIKSPETQLDEVMLQLRVHAERPDDDVIDHDIILVWGTKKRVITGADILGRLLRGIAIADQEHPEGPGNVPGHPG